MAERFVPPYPPRPAAPVPSWRGLYGERARTLVYGWSERAFSETYLFRKVLGWRVHIPLEPQAIQHVLLNNAANYEKPRLVKTLLAPVIGRGLLTSDGPLWRAQRQIVAASFNPPAVDALVPVFAAQAERRAKGWAGGVLDVAEEATTTTMQVITEALFSGDKRLTSRTALTHIAAALEGFSEARLQVLMGLPVFPVTLRGLRGLRGQAYLRRTLTQIVEERLRPGAPDDFVTGMIHALSEKYSRAEAVSLAVDNAATFYLAGHETTANSITWTLYLLSEQPDLQEAVAAEAQAALASGADARLPTRLPLLQSVVEESLRLYPAAPRFDREAIGEDEICGYRVRRGDFVSIWPWLLHRHRALWDDPDAFDPQRFTPDRKKGRHRFQYIPFGAGPRTCVGARFAIAEALTILAVWIARWSFGSVRRPVRLSGSVTLRPLGGMPLKMTPRS
ncbi:cytochrome P450 [Sphingomonas lutea]|uniref:Cytochrome P450 n=1 Tax=Sphingomonas lutea TaxID=1045317 RepID=A0A7G9SJN1_9SPHN|nr:cytochrome P450 [Sphingomonas lutea]QNN68056.1 cytochrome P450 [Sphingomonas lutea]